MSVINGIMATEAIKEGKEIINSIVGLFEMKEIERTKRCSVQEQTKIMIEIVRQKTEIIKFAVEKDHNLKIELIRGMNKVMSNPNVTIEVLNFYSQEIIPMIKSSKIENLESENLFGEVRQTYSYKLLE